MNWKSAIRAGNGEQLSNDVIDVIENQGDVDYLQHIQGLLTVNLYAHVPPQKDDAFIEDVFVATLLESGYDEFESFRCFESSTDSDDPSPWQHGESDWSFEQTDHAVQVAKQQGIVAHHRRVFGTLRVGVEAYVPVNWSDDEKRLTCIGLLLKEGPDRVLDVNWQDAPEMTEL